MLELIKEQFGQTILEKRKEGKMKQKTVASMCGISTRQYIDLEKGKRLPSMTTLVNLVIIFDLDLNRLVDSLVEAGYKIIDTGE